MSAALHTHSAPIDPDRPRWRYGRWHLWAPQRGDTSWNGRPRDIELSSEWSVLPSKADRHGVGVIVRIGCPGGGSDIKVSLYASPIGSLWLRLSGVLPSRFAPRGYRNREIQLRGMTYGTGWESAHLRWSVWSPEHEWCRTDPWWKREHTFGVQNLLGRESVSCEVIDSGTCVVPLPEANYQATWTTTRYTTTWRHRLGRLRTPRVHYRTEVRPGQPVLVPGKGENSWDLGDDHVHATSIGGRSVTEAIAALVGSVLRQRDSYGGQHMSVPGGVS